MKCNIKHCVKSVRIWGYSGPYSVRLREKTDQTNSKYGHFLRSVINKSRLIMRPGASKKIQVY